MSKLNTLGLIIFGMFICLAIVVGVVVFNQFSLTKRVVVLENKNVPTVMPTVEVTATPSATLAPVTKSFIRAVPTK